MANLKSDQLQLLNRLRVIVGTIFPNLSFIETASRSGAKGRDHPAMAAR